MLPGLRNRGRQWAGRMRSNHAGNIDRPIPLYDYGVLHPLIGLGFDMLALGLFFFFCVLAFRTLCILYYSDVSFCLNFWKTSLCFCKFAMVSTFWFSDFHCFGLVIFLFFWLCMFWIFDLSYLRAFRFRKSQAVFSWVLMVSTFWLFWRSWCWTFQISQFLDFLIFGVWELLAFCLLRLWAIWKIQMLGLFSVSWYRRSCFYDFRVFGLSRFQDLRIL